VLKSTYFYTAGIYWVNYN